MTMLITRRGLLQAGAAGAALATLGARAQTAWPSKPVTLIVPFPAGGGTDAFARPFAAEFFKQAGTSMVVDNRGGAGGTLGATAAARASADGYTLFMGAIHHAIAPSIYPKLNYDLEKDFVPLALLAEVPQVVVVNPQRISAPTIQALIDELRKRPGEFDYASAGSGTSHHLAGELFKLQTKTDITHIPYRGAGPAVQDLVGGNVDMMFDGLGSSAAYIKSGRIKALMVAGSARNPSLPDVPCAAEIGLTDYNVTTWYGLWAPVGTPAEIQARVVELTQRIGQADGIRSVWDTNGAQFGTQTPQEFQAFVQAEIARWAEVVKAAGIKLE